MTSKLVTRDVTFQPNKKITLRRWGVFAFLGAITFAVQWWFSLGNIGTSLLILGLAFLAGFIFPKLTTKVQGQGPDTFTKPIFQMIVKFMWLIAITFILSIVWFWLSQLTGISSKIFAALTFALTGLGLIVWSCIPIADE